ncbi:MAG: DUF222 domain-containing protein, partial [Acidimicrobiales bacterium]
MAGRHGLVDRLAGDPRLWGREARVAVLSELARFRGWLDAREAALLAVCHAECDDVNSGARDITQLCQKSGNMSFGEAKRRALRSEHLPLLPAAAAALESGVLGSAQADELCALADRLKPDHRPALTAAEAHLVGELCSLTPVQARKRLAVFEADLATDDGKSRLDSQRAQNRLRFPKKSDGTTGIHGQLDPLSGAYLRTCIDNKISEMWRQEAAHRKDADVPVEVISNERRRAEALVELVREGHSGGPGSRGRAEILVLIDYQTLLGQLAEAGICRLGDGTPIPPDVARRLACEADIIPVVLGGQSMPLDVGRASRLATPAQRAALRAVHDTRCVSRCDVPFEYTQIHHIFAWGNHGLSNLAHLVPLCSKHHHLIHDHGWTLTLDPDRTGTLTRASPKIVIPGTHLAARFPQP